MPDHTPFFPCDITLFYFPPWALPPTVIFPVCLSTHACAAAADREYRERRNLGHVAHCSVPITEHQAQGWTHRRHSVILCGMDNEPLWSLGTLSELLGPRGWENYKARGLFLFFFFFFFHISSHLRKRNLSQEWTPDYADLGRGPHQASEPGTKSCQNKAVVTAKGGAYVGRGRGS